MHQKILPSLSGIGCIIAVFFAVLLFASFSTAADGSQAPALFSAPEQKIPQTAIPPASDLVLRQRAAIVHLDELPSFRRGRARVSPELGSVTLNLFSGVSYIATPDSFMQMAGGFTVWTGRIEGHEDSSLVTLVYGNGVLNGAIRVAQSYFQVRSQDNGVQVIREIDTQALPVSAECTGLTGMEQSVVTLVNQERAVEGLHSLACNDSLSVAARLHSQDMAQLNYFSHTSLDGRTFVQRISASGYSYSYAGENIAYGYPSADAVMQGWMGSAGHRSNIMNANYCDIGVGYATHANSGNTPYWTQDFGRLAGVSQCSVSPDPDPQEVAVSGQVKDQTGLAISGVTITFSNGGGTLTTNTSGDYVNTLPNGWTGTVTPSKTGYTFAPAVRSLNDVTIDMSGQNFTGNKTQNGKPKSGFIPSMLPVLLE